MVALRTDRKESRKVYAYLPAIQRIQFRDPHWDMRFVLGILTRIITVPLVWCELPDFVPHVHYGQDHYRTLGLE